MSVCYSNCNCCQLVTELRAALATVTAERDRAQAAMSCAGGRLILKSELDAERAAHAETRKALENAVNAFYASDRLRIDAESAAEHLGDIEDMRVQANLDLESTRAALARSEAKIKAAQGQVKDFECWAAIGPKMVEELKKTS